MNRRVRRLTLTSVLCLVGAVGRLEGQEAPALLYVSGAKLWELDGATTALAAEIGQWVPSVDPLGGLFGRTPSDNGIAVRVGVSAQRTDGSERWSGRAFVEGGAGNSRLFLLFGPSLDYNDGFRVGARLAGGVHLVKWLSVSVPLQWSYNAGTYSGVQLILSF